MDGARLNNLILKGRGHAAKHIGLLCNVYRPITVAAPFTNRIAALPIALNAADEKYLKPNLYNKPVWYADFDARQTCAGDYIERISDSRIWFIAAQQPLLPIVAIDCNRLVRVSRQSVSGAVCGATTEYSGLVLNPGDVLGTPDSLWPASILLGGRALSSIGLPGDVKEGGWRILLPPSIPLALQASDIVTDDLGRRYSVESAESTDLGWRLNANEDHS